jgi:hypothetical protein
VVNPPLLNEELAMAGPMFHPPREYPPDTTDYLALRLDGARDLYLLALALGERTEGAAPFGRMIREARIHFAAVIEEARIAGLDTGAIAGMLGRSELADSIRPELWVRLEQLLAERAARTRKERPRSSP